MFCKSKVVSVEGVGIEKHGEAMFSASFCCQFWPQACFWRLPPSQERRFDLCLSLSNLFEARKGCLLCLFLLHFNHYFALQLHAPLLHLYSCHNFHNRRRSTQVVWTTAILTMSSDSDLYYMFLARCILDFYVIHQTSPVEWKLGAAKSFHSYHPWLYTYDVLAADPNWFCAAVAPIFQCGGLYTLWAHRHWESHHTPAPYRLRGLK